MFRVTDEPTDCEIWFVICFLKGKRVQPSEIHRQNYEVYGDYATSDTMIRNWVTMFNEH